LKLNSNALMARAFPSERCRITLGLGNIYALVAAPE
jgi:hypothetical protein